MRIIHSPTCVNVFLVLSLVVEQTISFGHLHAQDNTTYISVAIPSAIANNFNIDLFSQFESEHSGVKVNIVKTDEFYPPAAFNNDGFFSDITHYVNSADVLYINDNSLSEEATRGGYFLNLSPLIQTDQTLDSGDFSSAVWQSFQWDNGFWALPLSASPLVFTYDPVAFDKASIPYPNSKWTINDLVNSVRKLTQRNTEGQVVLPGLLLRYPSLLFRSLLGDNLYDNSTLPNQPELDKPGLIDLVNTLSTLESEGDIASVSFQGDLASIPLSIEPSFTVTEPVTSGVPRRAALLPGGTSGLSIDGFAVSGGTQYPDLAYALAKFMMSNADVVSQFAGETSVRKSLSHLNQVRNMSDPASNFSNENDTIIQQAFDNAIPTADMRYSDYVTLALVDIYNKGVDAKTALEMEQTRALNMLQIADESKKTQKLMVAITKPTVDVGPTSSLIKFSLVTPLSSLPNQDEWNQVINDFTSNDPTIKQIQMNINFGPSPNTLAVTDDCFIFPYNALSMLDPTKILDLQPLMATDPSFDKSDYLGNTLTQFQYNDETLGFPLFIQPQILRYNSTIFSQLGIGLPDADWTIDQFTDVLKVLKSNSPESPFVPLQANKSYILMLIAAFGGVPLDFRVNPPEIDFTSSVNTDAIRQVLDLAKAGYIKYQKLTLGDKSQILKESAISTDSLNLLNLAPNIEGDTYRLINYPRGSKFVPVAYDTGAAYISSQASDPGACYRWIAALSRHPELFLALPPRRSLLNNYPIGSEGADIAVLSKLIDESSHNVSVLVLPTENTNIEDHVLVYILFRVFDHYILENANLDDELRQANVIATGYESCVSNAVPNLPDSLLYQSEYKQFTDCATKIDPSLGAAFNVN